MRETILTSGIILSAMPVGEADRRLSLLTKELGKVSCFVRGARKPTNRFVGETRPFAFGTFELLPGRDAYQLYRTEISDYFEAVTSDLVRSAYGSCFLELAGRVCHENTDGGPVLSLLYYALRTLAKGVIRPSLTKTVFEAKILQTEGLLPSFQTCAKCGKAVDHAVFKPAMMQIVCADCDTGEAVYPLSKSALYALNHIAGAEMRTLFTFSVTEEVEKEMTDVVRILMRHTMDKPLRSEALLNVLAGAKETQDGSGN